ncbi:MAG: hypothetical protein WC068_15680 [Caulobacter sp.]
MSQFDLFARTAGPFQPVYTPEPDNIRARLTKILDELREAEAMPWASQRERMYRNIVPQMTNWLPNDEAARWKADFMAELSRLEAA